MPNTDHTKHDQQQIANDKQEVFDAGMKRIFISAGLALVALLVFTFAQRSGRIPFFTQNFLSLLVLGAIIVQAYIYHRQWEAMQHTLREMRATRELENRAWIGVKEVRLDEVPGIGLAVNAIYVNGGNSPALASIEVHGSIMSSSPPDDFEFASLPTAGSKLGFFPHVERQGTLLFLPKHPGVDLKNPEHAFYILGKIDYEDIFSRPHTTRFCYRMQANPFIEKAHGGQVRSSLVVAPTHNTFN